MSASMSKTFIILMLYVISAPNIFSVGISAVGMIYFITMIYMNCVLPRHNGSWRAYLRWVLRGLISRFKKNG